MKKLIVAVVGLGFGREFLPIYRSHPAVDRVIIVDSDSSRLKHVGETFGVLVTDCRTNIDQVLDDVTIDAVHILTPVPSHAELTIKVMQAGKHCACAVPMATNLTDIERIIAIQRQTNVNYMMMETAVYSREYFELSSLYDHDKLGEITLYRGFHIQNLDGFPNYWQGYPPMQYLTHALSPILELLNTYPTKVSARGTGQLTANRRTGGFDNPFPCEIGLFTLADSPVIADITMAFFQTGRSFIEGFDIYGDRGGLEWSRDHDGPLKHYAMSGPTEGKRGNTVSATEVKPQDVTDGLTSELRPFVQSVEVKLPGMLVSEKIESHHSGSHPHLVDEFIKSIIENRPPHIGPTRAAQWSAAGIIAHDSALRNGTELNIPNYL